MEKKREPADISFFSRLSTKMILYSLTLFVLLLILVLSSLSLLSTTSKGFLTQAEFLGNTSIQYSIEGLKSQAEDNIKDKSMHSADMLRDFLDDNPGMTIQELENDEHMKRVAIVSVGKTGYTAVHDTKGINHFHVNPALVGSDLHDLAERFPSFWVILEKSLTEDAEGYYDWEDADGNIRQKYMYCAHVRDSDLITCATTYIDEFFGPLNAAEESIRSSVSQSKEQINSSLRTASLFIIVLSILVLIFFLYIISILNKKVVDPINKLRSATEEIQKGDFSVRVDIHTGGEIQELGESFNRTIDALQELDDERLQLDKAKTEFLSITSHELRSPMTPMKAQMQMLLKGYYGKLNQKQKDALDIVLRNTDRLDSIIVDLLEVSRIEAGRLKFRFVKTDLTDTIKRLVEEMKGFMPEKKIQLMLEIGKLPVIEVDPDRVMQVLRNLINNAIKFSPAKSKIHINISSDNKEIFFSVKDTGIGMGLKDVRGVFEPFYQVEHTLSRKVGGTGLGLTICKGIIESQKGRIWAESTLNKGTTFYFTVPLTPVKEIKPLKLMFSGRGVTDQKIMELFRERLGPVGLNEFNDIKEKTELTPESLSGYIDTLVSQGVVSKEESVALKKSITLIFEGAVGEKEGSVKKPNGFEEQMDSFFRD
ncbi:MAG: HAMP domain-containing protein [Nanoarchaeota archaeon]|nr:HAMP domain-containing protein [Nanoarchaeota archaeon]